MPEVLKILLALLPTMCVKVGLLNCLNIHRVPRGEITHSTMGADNKAFAHDLQPRFCNHDLATILTSFIIISLKEEIKSLWRQALRFSFN